VQALGGEFIVRGGQQQVLEGQAHGRTVVIRFPSYAVAQAFYESPEYRKAREVRAGAGSFVRAVGMRKEPSALNRLSARGRKS